MKNLTILAIVLLLAPTAFSSDNPARAAVEQTLPSVCMIFTKKLPVEGEESEELEFTTTGIFISPNRVVALKSLINDSTEVVVRTVSFSTDEPYVIQEIPVTRFYTTSNSDLVVLQISHGGGTEIRYAPSQDVRIGNKMFAVGFNQELALQLAEGIIANRKVVETEGRKTLYAGSLVSSRGAAVVTASGDLIGISLGSLPGTSVRSYLIPAEVVRGMNDTMEVVKLEDLKTPVEEEVVEENTTSQPPSVETSTETP